MKKAGAGNTEKQKKPTSKHRDSSKEKKKRRKKLSNLPCHHHLLLQEGVDYVLKKIGDFLVRETVLPEGKAAVIVCVKEKESVKHYAVQYSEENETFSFVPSVAKSNIVDLIEHHYRNKVPIYDSRLITPIPLTDWEILDDHKVVFDEIKLGQGNFATVYKGKCKSSSVASGAAAVADEWFDVAYKRPRTERLKSKQEKDKMKYQLLREFQAARLAGTHRCLLKIFGIYVGSENMALVMEFCDGGSLDGYLRRNKGNKEVYAKIIFMGHAADGLAHMHEHGLIHRDVAARNFLLVNRSKQRLLPLVKIADFGLTRAGPVYRMSSEQEVPFTICPTECLKDDSHWTYKSDVWSYGVLIHQVFDECQTELYSKAGSPFFNSAMLLEILESGYRLPATADMPEECQTLMGQCFSADPNARPDVNSVKSRLEIPLKSAWREVFS